MNKPLRLGLLFILIILVFYRSSQELIFLSDRTDAEPTPRLEETNTQHLIKPGDVLYISIRSIDPVLNAAFNSEEGGVAQSSQPYQKLVTPQGAYLYGFEVNANGDLSMPILGKIQVKGQPQQKIKALIQEKADIYLKDALVKVKLLNFKVTVLGEVRSPGVYYNYNNTFTVLEALVMASGNTDFATIQKIMVLRHGIIGNTSFRSLLPAPQRLHVCATRQAQEPAAQKPDLFDAAGGAGIPTEVEGRKGEWRWEKEKGIRPWTFSLLIFLLSPFSRLPFYHFTIFSFSHFPL